MEVRFDIFVVVAVSIVVVAVVDAVKPMGFDVGTSAATCCRLLGAKGLHGV